MGGFDLGLESWFLASDEVEEASEGEALAELLDIRPPVVPNLMIVEHADDILGRNGRLLETVKSWDDTLDDNRVRRILNREAVLREYGIDSFSRPSS